MPSQICWQCCLSKNILNSKALPTQLVWLEWIRLGCLYKGTFAGWYSGLQRKGWMTDDRQRLLPTEAQWTLLPLVHQNYVSAWRVVTVLGMLCCHQYSRSRALIKLFCELVWQYEVCGKWKKYVIWRYFRYFIKITNFVLGWNYLGWGVKLFLLQ